MQTVVIVLFFFFIVLSIKARQDEKKDTKIKLDELRDSFGKYNRRQHTQEDMERFSHYHHCNAPAVQVDDITFNDLYMSELFCRMDSTQSFYGKEQLYHILRSPKWDEAELKQLDKCVEYMSQNDEQRARLLLSFSRMASKGVIPLCDCMEELDTITDDPRRAITIDLVCMALGGFATYSIFAFPTAGFFIFFTVLFVNLMIYYRRKKSIAPYIACFSEILRLIYGCRSLDFTDMMTNLSDEVLVIKKTTNSLGRFAAGAFLLTSGRNATGNLTDVILDYFRMFLHLDIIKFYMMLNVAKEKKNDILELSKTVGYLDACISIASFRASLPYYCKPAFDSEDEYAAAGGFNPLIENCVPNDIRTKNGVLLTGSNASGKSSFLRTTALMAILAQTIYTVPAREYHFTFVRVATSMSLNDSMLSGESYYMVEIKSLKRIMEYADSNEKLLCFIDEVLRGTNTVERISASKEILSELAERSICFAATHDIELAMLLQDKMDNFHFSEDIDTDNEKISFSYKIQEGKSESTNAIKLLSLIGFENSIIAAASANCLNYLKTGKYISEEK